MKIESRLAGKILRPGQALLHGSPERIKIPLSPPLKKGEDLDSSLLRGRIWILLFCKGGRFRAPPFVKGGKGGFGGRVT